MRIVSVNEVPSIQGPNVVYHVYNDDVGWEEGDYDMGRDSGRAMRLIWQAAKKVNPKVIHFSGCGFPKWHGDEEYLFYFTTLKKYEWYVVVRVTLYS